MSQVQVPKSQSEPEPLLAYRIDSCSCWGHDLIAKSSDRGISLVGGVRGATCQAVLMFQTAIALAILLLPATVFSSELVRGLDPALLPHYTASSGSFTCLDELKTIRHTNINDQYCDCFDGSDEPGESTHVAFENAY